MANGGAAFVALKVEFGEHKGALASTLTPAQLLATIALGNENLAKATGRERWYLKTKAHVADLRALYVGTAPASAPPLQTEQPAPREPGQEG
jgi:hypothetical protein